VVTSAEATINHTWWQVFNDATLNDLIQRALAHNLDLQVAEARVEEARAARKGARANLLPQVNITGGASRGNDASTGYNSVSNTTQAAVEASWELDLFGRTQKQVSAASAQLQSAEARKHAVQVALLSEVARNYFTLRNLERQVLITEQNLATQRRTLEIIQARFDLGDASEFDRQRTAAQVSTTEALLPTFKAAADAARNRLSVLVGELPGNIKPGDGTARPLAAQTQVLVAAPATVLANRPDIQAAERDFAAAFATTQAERRSWLPRINLLGMFGVLDNTAFSANPWSVGASLIQPVLNFGTIGARIDAANARQQQAFLGYKQTVLTAVEDMENALSAYINETSRYQSLQNSLAQNGKALELAQEQFKVGDIDLLDQLIAERNKLQAESDLASSEALLNQNLVAIYAASGGGWEATPQSR
jgi:multidrug efflux system outer membrane protein